MRTERFKGALLSTLVIASLIAPVVSLLGNVGSVYSTPELVIYPDADIFADSWERYFPQLKFDISAIPQGKFIISAKLYFYRYSAEGGWGGTGYVMRVDNQTWDETITYDEFRNQTITNVESFVGKWPFDGWDWVDVTDQLNADYIGGRTYTSFRLSGVENLFPMGDVYDLSYLLLNVVQGIVNFYSRETLYAPYLEVNYGPLLPYQVEVEISPAYREGLPGGTLGYSVKVTNWGSIADNYLLTLVDNSGWVLNISPSKLEIENAGKSEYATLSVTIPPGAPIGAVDNVVVIATSEDNVAASDNFWCLADAGRRIRPTIDDAQVVKSLPTFNFGGANYMYVGSSTTAYQNERAFLKFDLRGITSLDNITSKNARLFVYAFTVNGTPGKNIELRRVDNDNWVEKDITWNDQPAYGAWLDMTALTEAAAWYSWDVTSYLYGEFTSDNIASFCIKAETENLAYPDNFSYGFDTKEFSSWAHPRIAIGRNVWTTISPNYREGLPGGTVKYTVNVWNMGSQDDSYTLTATDDSGWGLALSDNEGVAVSAGERKKIELSVTIPENARICVDDDNITVIVTSENDSTVSDDYWVIAHAAKRVKPAMLDTSTKNGDWLAPTIWGIDETIYVGHYAGGPERGWLRFDLGAIPSLDNIARARLNLHTINTLGEGAIVQVHRVDDDTWIEDINWDTMPSIGSVLDTRAVTEADTWYSWDVTSFVQEQFQSDNKASFALVHLGENIDTTNNAARFTSREDWDARDKWPYLEISCEAQLPTNEVRTYISPVFQGGIPGTTENYTVTVKNTGTSSDTYSLTVDDNLGWGATVLPTSLPIGAGASDTATLSVTVPSGTPCTLDKITVTTTGTGVSDDAMCFAHLSKAKISLYIEWCYGFGVNIDLNLLLREDSRNLVAKFYTWAWVYETENVVWSGMTPAQVVMVKDVPHPFPMHKPERVRLVLTDEENNEVQTISTFMTTRSTLIGAISQIKARWPFATPEERTCLIQMISAIKGIWPFAPL